jgi:hypothetical protein
MGDDRMSRRQFHPQARLLKLGLEMARKKKKMG